MDYNPKYALYRIDTNLGLAENDFNKIFKVYPMDENAETIVNEGIVSGITKGAKFIGNAIISAITTLWHKLVKFVQGIVAKIKKFFKGDTDKAPNHPNMEVRFISEANLIKGNFHNTKDIVDAGMKAIESITNKINQISQQQISITQECNRRIEAAKNQPNQQQSPVQQQNPPAQQSVQPAQEAKTIYGKNVTVASQGLGLGGNGETGMSLSGHDAVSTSMETNLSTFDKKMHEAVLEADDIVQAYNDFINNFITAASNRMENDKLFDSSDGQLVSTCQYIMQSINPATNANYTENEMLEYIKGNFFDSNMDPEHIRRMFQMRLNYNKRITTFLSKMVLANYKILGIAKGESEELAKGIKGNDRESIDKMADQVRKNIKEFMPKPGFIDFRSLGAGVVFYLNDDPLMSLVEKDPAPILQRSFSYDCVICTHGVQGGKVGETDEDQNQKDILVNKIKKMHREVSEKTKNIPHDSDYFNKVKAITSKYEDTYKKLLTDVNSINSKSGWECMPIAIGNYPATSDVNTVVRNAISSGYKKIFLYVCNPDNHSLAPDILKTKGVIIHISRRSVLLDNKSAISAYRNMGNDEDLKKYADTMYSHDDPASKRQKRLKSMQDNKKFLEQKNKLDEERNQKVAELQQKAAAANGDMDIINKLIKEWTDNTEPALDAKVDKLLDEFEKSSKNESVSMIEYVNESVLDSLDEFTKSVLNRIHKTSMYKDLIEGKSETFINDIDKKIIEKCKKAYQYCKQYQIKHHVIEKAVLTNIIKAVILIPIANPLGVAGAITVDAISGIFGDAAVDGAYGEAGGAGPGGMVGTADLAFVTQYGPDSKFSNASDRVEGYALHNDIITDNIITVDRNGKVKKESYDFLNNRKIRMFQYTGDNISEAMKYIIDSIGKDAERAFIYEELTGRELLSDDQILCDEQFKEIDPMIIGAELTSEIQTMVEHVKELMDETVINIPIMNSKDIREADTLLEGYNNEVQVFESVKGFYAKNLRTGKRTACYKKIKNIPAKVVR